MARSASRLFDSPLSTLLIVPLLVALASPPRQAPAADCNGNGVADDTDITSGASSDCDADRLPDECEVLPLLVGSVTLAALPGTSGEAAVGDLDGDGRPDLAVATLQPGDLGVTVFLDPASGGDGIDNVLAAPALGVDCGDLDGDGDLDMAAARSTDIRVFHNAGDGTFPTRSYVGQGAAFAAVRIGDLDGDRVNDVVAPRSDRGAVALFRGQGGGKFASAVEVSVQSPGALSLVDVDKDGDLDILVLDGQGSIDVLENSGDGSVAAPAPVSAAGVGLQAFASGDLDGDGFPDLAAIDASRLLVLYSRGDGSFDLGSTFVVEDDVVLGAVAIGDPDGDGRREIVLGRTRLGTVGELQLVRPVLGGGLEPSRSVGHSSRPGSILLVDLDGDGTDEVIVPAAGAGEVAIVERRGAQPSEPSPLLFRTETLSLAEFGNFEPHMPFLADLDGDGRLDLATHNGETRVMTLRNQGNGTQGDETIYVLRDSLELIAIAPADLDRDGDVDIAAVDESTDNLLILLNDGSGAFVQTAQSYRADDRPYFVVAADLDGDGDLDIVTANERAGTIGIFRNHGDATFESQQSLPMGAGPVGLVARDLDGDGDVDLAVGKGTAAEVSIFRNDGDGGLGDRVDHEVGAVSYVYGADLEGDGDIDVVAARESGSGLTVLRNAGGGSFEVASDIDLGQPPRSVIATDLDGDGLPDLVTGNEDTGTISILRNLGGVQFGAPSRHTVGRAPRFVVSGDLDGDARNDLVVANHTSLDFTFLFNEAAVPEPILPLERICTELDYFRLARPVAGEDIAELEVLYLVPARAGDPQLLPTVFLPTGGGLQPWEMLAEAFPERFDGLTEEGYLQLVARRATRDYFAGSILRLRPRGGVVHGFTIVTDAALYPGERILVSEAAAAYGALDAAFLLEPLAYYPDTAGARADARSWGDPGFPILIREPPVPLRRGDALADGALDLSDAVALLDYLFRDGGSVPCVDAADANDDGDVDISDAVVILLHLFGSLGDLPPPADACGLDPTDDALPCGAFLPCT